MASRLVRCITALVVAITWCFAASPARVRAATASTHLHHFKFFIDPALLTDVQLARLVLPRYVADLNTVLAKNTNRQLVFDPAIDIVLAPVKPETDTAMPPLPTDGFEIWAYVLPPTATFGPFASVDASGAGVLAGIRWSRIHDPDALVTAAEAQDYNEQLRTMLHELAHVFGAGIGEYYSLSKILDPTQAQPLLNISASDPADRYWSDKQDFMADPLLPFVHASNRLDFLSQARYSALTAAVISGSYRNGVPSFNQFTVKVVDTDGLPVPSAEVKVWNIKAQSPYSPLLLNDVFTDSAGQVTVPWGGPPYVSPHSVGNMLRLIKVYRDGEPLAEPRYISVFDGDMARLVGQQSAFTISLQANHAPTDLTLSNTLLDENQPAGTVIGSLSALDLDPGDSLTYTLCGGADDGSFSLVDASLLSASAFDYETKSSYTVCLAAIDPAGASLRRSFTINVANLPDTSARLKFRSQGAVDGWVLESSQGSGRGGTVNAAATSSLVGFDALGRQYRSVLSFDTSSLPDNAVVTGVTLRIRTREASASLAGLKVDMRRDFLGSTLALQPADYQARAASVGTFGEAQSDGWYAATLDASAATRVDVAGTTQFRISFDPALTALSAGSHLSLYTGNAVATYRPQLVVDYDIP